MHSINKKSSRISQKLFNSLGMDHLVKNSVSYQQTPLLNQNSGQAHDFTFDDLEKRFSNMTRSIQLFMLDSGKFRETLHEVAVSQFNIAENVADLYKDKVHIREVERFRSAQRNIISTYWNQYVSQQAFLSLYLNIFHLYKANYDTQMLNEISI